MHKRDNLNGPTAAEQAIHSALESERRVHEAVEECRRQADEQLQQARAKAQRIEARTDARIGAVHALCAQRVAETIQHMLDQAARQPARDDQLHPDEYTLRTAADHTIGVLIGVNRQAPSESNE